MSVSRKEVAAVGVERAATYRKKQKRYILAVWDDGEFLA